VTAAKRFHQAVLISCEIPWDEHERLVEAVFRQEVRLVLAKGFNNLYVFGTAGEGYAVDTARFQQIVRIFHEETRAAGVHAQVGVIGLSTANILERIEFAYRTGFRIFQVSLPSWGALNDREMLRFFQDVCSAFPDARFLHYNLMRSKRLLTPADYRRIADVVPNLAATKNTGTDVSTTAELIRQTPEIQHFLGETMFPTGCLWGECSLLSSFGALIPAKTREFFEYGRTCQIEKLFRFQKEYLDKVGLLLQVMLKHNRIDGAYDKLFVRLAGLDMPLRLLSPYEALPDDVFETCRKIVAEEFSGWLG
jgi:dihydrodipicolinate synthase/N-acetylneuraminate lyase